MLKLLFTSAVLVSSGLSAVFSADAVKPSTRSPISRAIGKQPRYVSKSPLYGLFFFGETTRVWAVFDKSRTDATRYDVLYFDRNADGDLTGPNERILPEKAKDDQPLEFDVGEFTDPKTKKTHTEVTFVNFDKPVQMMAVMLKWEGKSAMFCGFNIGSPDRWRYQFANDPQKAPVYFVGTGGPLVFRRMPPAPDETDDLTIGDETDFNVIVGRPGVNHNAFTAIGYDRIPEKLPVIVTLHYESTDGKRKKLLTKLRERC